MDSVCRLCTQPYKQYRYACCSSTKFYCYKCSLMPCKFCHKSPQIEFNTNAMRQSRREKQPMVSKFRSCAACKHFESISEQDYLQESHCKYYFCYKCILSLYEKYVLTLNEIAKQTGIRPEYPFELPCRCELPQAEVLQFLQKSCYCCGKSIHSRRSFRLRNNMRVMEKCLIGTRYLSSSQKLKLNQLNEMVLRCDGCDSPLAEVLPNDEQLNVCRHCYDLNKSQVQNLEIRQQRRQKENEKLVALPLKQSKKQKAQQQKRQVQDQRNGIQTNEEKNNSNILKQKEHKQVAQQLKSKVPNNGNLSNGQKKKGQNSTNQKESLELLNLQSKEIKRQPFQQMIQGPLQMRSATFSDLIFKNLVECSQCCIFLRQSDQIFSFQQTVQKYDQKLAKQSVKSTRNLCKLCYCKLKQKTLSSAPQRNIDNEQSLFKSRLYKSTTKAEKRPENKIQPKTNNIFSKFDYLYEPSFAPPITKTAEKLQAPKNIELNTRFNKILNRLSNHQKCQHCGEDVMVSQFNKKSKKCRNCEANGLPAEKVEKLVEITCKMCKKVKCLKQSEVGKFGYCKECLLKPYK